MPPWVRLKTPRKLKVDPHHLLVRSLGGARGSKFGSYNAAQLEAVNETIDRGVLAEQVQLRHPFLHRPLVEFALGLPPEFTAQPFARKWVLRAAMDGVLPEKVRTRTGKGSITGRLAWSLQRESQYLKNLVKRSLLADLGCVEPKRLLLALEDAQSGKLSNITLLFHALSVETWLSVRAGRVSSVGLNDVAPLPPRRRSHATDYQGIHAARID